MYPVRHEELPWETFPQKEANRLTNKHDVIIPKELSLDGLSFRESIIFLVVQKFLEKEGLSEEQISALNTSFHNIVERIRQRIMYDSAGVLTEKDAQTLARVEALLELEKEVKSLKESEKEGDERLIPYLLSKQSAHEQITRSLENINRMIPGKRAVLLTANFDLDGLKGLNDKYDHLVGDIALRYFGAKLHAAIRPGGGANAYHYSGDEFGISIEMEFPEDTDDEEIVLRAKLRMEEIVKQIAFVDDPNVLHSKKQETGNTDREDLIVRAYDKSPKSGISIRKTFLDKFELDRKKIAPNGFQEVSSGFVITFPNSSETFTSIQKKADSAANTSKLIPYLELVKNNFATRHITRPTERLLSAEDIEQTMGEYSKEEIERASFLRGISREAKQLAPHVRFTERMRLIMISPKLLEKYALAVAAEFEANTENEKKLAKERQTIIWNAAMEIERLSSAL